MGYIQKTVQPQKIFRLNCTHPKVERIWEYGGLAEIPTSSLAKRILCIAIIEKGHYIVYEFEDNGDGEAIKEAEKFLEKL